jgi:hypothetical protein
MQRRFFILQAPLSQHLGGSCPFPKKRKAFKVTPRHPFSDERNIGTAVETIIKCLICLISEIFVDSY